jgi:hypothetical protein
LYCLRRYEEARGVADDALKGRLNDEFRKVVSDYRGRCEAKIRVGEKD